MSEEAGGNEPDAYLQLNTSDVHGVLMKPLAYEYPGDSDFTNNFTHMDRFAGDTLKQITITQKGN